ncbi:MAG TPA: DUF1501 domain-containing protein [Mycobacteriales bacterium]|nr:DUF1501 domain-containing protein [Mycobacteriales bacterium]
MSRRQFLTASGVVGAAALAAGATEVPWSSLFAAASRAPLAAGSGILVLVTLYGGNDGLSTVVPYADPAYHSARPDLAYSEAEVLHLDDQLGLNPSMTSLANLWRAGRLAVVRGVSYPSPDLSHFRSMAIWQTASPGTPEPTGWLGRWLDATGTDPLRAVGVGPTLPPLLAGAKVAGATVNPGPIILPGGALGSALRAVEQPYPGETELLGRAAQTGADLFTVADRLGPVLAALDGGGRTGATVTGPIRENASGELARSLAAVRACIAASVPTRVYAVSMGNFDTHADEKGTQSQLIGEFDSAMGQFLDGLENVPHGKDVVVVAYTEFGRRVAANASQGTDHGTANDVFVAGPSIRGGFYGGQPSLTDLDLGNLKWSVDFRSIYATVLERVLGVDASVSLGTQPLPRLSFI